MRNILRETSFDWSRNKTDVTVQRRGIASLVTPALDFGKTNAAPKSKPRCIWPSILETSDSKFLSRRVWSR